jgi:hypothetical protein
LVASVDFADALDQQRYRHFLQDDSADAESHRLQDAVFVQACGQEYDPRGQLLLMDLPQHRQSVLARHHDIEDQHIRLVLAYGTQSLLAIRATSDDLEIGFLSQEELQALEDKQMIVS